MLEELIEIRHKLKEATDSGDKTLVGFAINDLDSFIYRNKKALRLGGVVATKGKLCGAFEPDNRTSSATICKHCGREKFLHPHN